MANFLDPFGVESRDCMDNLESIVPRNFMKRIILNEYTYADDVYYSRCYFIDRWN